MKNVNTTICCYKNIISNGNNELAFVAPSDEITANKNFSGHYYLKDYKIVTQFCLLGTSNEEKAKTNLVNRKGSLEVLIRLTRCDPNPEKQLGTTLDKFTINLCELESKISRACFQFLNYTRVTDIDETYLESGPGKYVIKVFVRPVAPDDLVTNQLTLQAMSRLSIVYN